MIAALIDGRLRTASGFVFPPACRDATRIWLAGGDPHLGDCPAWLPLPTLLAADPVFAGALGGARLLGGAAGAVVDLGQSSAKVVTSGRPPMRVWRGGRTWDAVLRDALATLTLSESTCDRLIVGLPAELSESAAGSCSYFDALSFEELALHLPCPTVVCTDAELAGLAAQEDLQSLSAPALALTLGHGVGAALVLP